MTVQNGTGTGTFNSNLTGLTPDQTYYVRSYAVTGCGTSYGNEISFITNGAGSDIIDASAFNETDNIDYTAYNATSGLTTVNSIKVGSFTIRDGGLGGDSETNSTTLTDITFSISNYENLAALAIFDGTTNLSETATVSASESFSSLSLVANDNGTKTFDVYCTFKSLVDDREQIQLTVTSATADANGTVFAAADAGGATNNFSDTDDNKIQVNFSSLAYGIDASNTCLGSSMTAVTVKAVDVNGNTDADFATDIRITSTGTLTGTPITASPISGLATFSSLSHSVAGSTLTLNAEKDDDGTLDIASASFDIITCNNDECVSAFPVATDGTPITSLDVTTYTSSGNNLSCDGGSSNEDSYYSFVAPASGIVKITVDNSNRRYEHCLCGRRAIYKLCKRRK